MWKKLVHARHLRKSANEQPAQESKTGDLAKGSHFQETTNLDGSTFSPLPVAYTTSPPTDPPVSSGAFSTVPVDYVLSPPSEPSLSGNASAVPIEYMASAPTITSSDTHGTTELPAVRSPRELSASSNLPTRPIELPATPVPVRHELGNSTVPPPTAASLSNGDTTNSTKSNWSKPSSPSSTTTAPLLDRSSGTSGSPSTAVRKEISVSKCTVQIYCQRKPSAPSPRREELPRDIREFRLAKIALIPVKAGQRRFASLDVVFGKADQGLASLLEKHFSITSDTTFSKLSDSGLADSEGVRVISPLTVAYEGDTSLVYVIFRSAEEETKFLADFKLIKEFMMDY